MRCDINNALPALVMCCYYLPGAPSMPFPEVHLWYWQTGSADSNLKSKYRMWSWGSGDTHVHSTTCGEDRSFWAGSKAVRWAWSKPDPQQLTIMPVARGMSGVPARLGSCLWKWSSKMVTTALECGLLSVLWVDVQIVWDLHWLEDSGLKNPGYWVSFGGDQLSEVFA